MPTTEAKAQKVRSKLGLSGEVFVAPGVGGSATFDGRYVGIERSGGLGRLTVGKGSKRIPVSAITGIHIKPAGLFVNGFIQFTIPGGRQVRSGFGAQTWDAAGDVDSVVFAKSDEAAFRKLRDLIESAQGAEAAGS